MKRNVFAFERAGRAILGVLLLALIFVGPKTVWGLVGIPVLATALIGY